jgi:hypothetical protein
MGLNSSTGGGGEGLIEMRAASCANVPSGICLRGWLLARWMWLWILGGEELPALTLLQHHSCGVGVCLLLELSVIGTTGSDDSGSMDRGIVRSMIDGNVGGL